MFEGLEDVECRLDLIEACKALTEKQRTALNLYLAGYTETEIGEHLGISQPAVTYRLQDAVQGIKRILS